MGDLEQILFNHGDERQSVFYLLIEHVSGEQGLRHDDFAKRTLEPSAAAAGFDTSATS